MQFSRLSSSKMKISEADFFDTLTIQNDQISYVKHVLAPLYVFFTLFGCWGGGWLPRGLGHNLLMQFSRLSSSRLVVPLPSSRCLAEGNRILGSRPPAALLSSHTSLCRGPYTVEVITLVGVGGGANGDLQNFHVSPLGKGGRQHAWRPATKKAGHLFLKPSAQCGSTNRHTDAAFTPSTPPPPPPRPWEQGELTRTAHATCDGRVTAATSRQHSVQAGSALREWQGQGTLQSSRFERD